MLIHLAVAEALILHLAEPWSGAPTVEVFVAEPVGAGNPSPAESDPRAVARAARAPAMTKSIRPRPIDTGARLPVDRAASASVRSVDIGEPAASAAAPLGESLAAAVGVTSELSPPDTPPDPAPSAPPSIATSDEPGLVPTPALSAANSLSLATPLADTPPSDVPSQSPISAAGPDSKRPDDSNEPRTPRTAATALAAPGPDGGSGLGRLRVVLEGPRSRVTDRATETLSGRIIGRGLQRLVLYANESAREVEADGQAFQVAVALERGTNRVRVVAVDASGAEAEDVVTVDYAPPVAANGIVLTSPANGLQLTRDDPPIVVVEGEVEDKSVSTVLLAANQSRVIVPVHAGRFRRALPILEPLVRLHGEAFVNGTVHQSPTVTVQSWAGTSAQFGVIVFDWPKSSDGLEVEVSAIWRPTPERLDVPTQTTVMKMIPSADGGLGSAYYLSLLKPGVYTFILRSRTSIAADGIHSTLYIPAGGTIARKDLPAFSLGGAERRLIARVLLPQGILWEQDEWFSGRSESVDTVTKFRFPDGISWVERKAGSR